MGWGGRLTGSCSTIRGLEALRFDLKVVYLKDESIMERVVLKLAEFGWSISPLIDASVLFQPFALTSSS